MFKKIFAILLISLMFFSFPGFKNVNATTLSSQQIEILQQEIAVLQSLISNYNLRQEISASSYIAVDLSNNSILLEKDPNTAYPIASVTKLMNAIVTLQTVKMDQTITLTEEMLKPYGQSPVLYAGLNISAENLLKATLTQSVNDAAQSLSYFVGNEKFINLMNQKAKELGMNNTAYYDAHGLNPANHSSATDLSKLIAYVYKQYPEILSITKDDNFWLPDSSGKILKFRNENNFYPLDDFIGGKTGIMGTLQTWRRDGEFHPHLHFLVPGGGLSPDGKYWLYPKNHDFLVAEKPLAKLFRNKFRIELKKLELEEQISQETWRKDWVADVENVGNGMSSFKYLAPYMQRGFISNNRIEAYDGESVTFHYKDSKTGEIKRRTMQAMQFMELFLQHVLPSGFQKTRYYGILGSANKKTLAELRLLILTSRNQPPPKNTETFVIQPRRCAKCGIAMKILNHHTRPPPEMGLT